MIKDLVDQHPYIQVVAGSEGGCPWFRANWPLYVANMMDRGFHVFRTPEPIVDGPVFAQTRSIVIHAIPTDEIVNMLKPLAALRDNYGFKLVLSFDDLPCEYHGQGRPQWHNAPVPKQENLVVAGSLVDTVIVSTEYLRSLVLDLCPSARVEVIENAIPRHMFSMERNPGKQVPAVPHIVASGAPMHYSGEFDDWSSGAWAEWLCNKVSKGEARFTLMGGVMPKYLQPIADKIKVIPWTPTANYPGLLGRLQPDLIIAPLVDNEYNRCKSDLRYIEAAAVNSAFMGSWFPQGAYEKIPEAYRVPLGATVDQIDKVYCQIMSQYGNLLAEGWRRLDDGRIMESENWIRRWISAVTGGTRYFIREDFR